MADDPGGLRPTEFSSGESRAAVGRRWFTVGLAVALMVLVWILATPRSAGPDEPGHNVRAGALARGQLEGEALPDSVFQEGYRLPAEVGFPDPVCFAFAPLQPATCAATQPLPTGDQLLGTRAADYPIWGHLPPGLGTFAPGEAAAWAARLLDAVLPVGLVTAALVVSARRRTAAAGATLLALTPMAWFMFAVVNPSGLVIAGGIALWVALLADQSAAAGQPTRGAGVGWLAAAGWAALVLPRRDGLIWAVLILALALLITGEEPRALWRRMSRGARLVACLAPLITLAWASRSDTNAALALFVTPLVPVGAVLARTVWRRLGPGAPAGRLAAVAAVVAGAGMVALFVDQRISDARRALLRLVIESTGADLTEAIGVLGWLDTPVPTSALYLWCIGLGLLVGAAVVAGQRSLLVGATAIVVTAIASSWVLTMVQTDNTANYWQGRYYLPLLAGVPIVLGRLDLTPDAARRVGVAVAGIAAMVINVALAAMMRRFGVGIAGSLLPWDWDTYRSPLPPVVLLVVHAATSVVLVRWVWLSPMPIGATATPMSGASAPETGAGDDGDVKATPERPLAH